MSRRIKILELYASENQQLNNVEIYAKIRDIARDVFQRKEADMVAAKRTLDDSDVKAMFSDYDELHNAAGQIGKDYMSGEKNKDRLLAYVTKIVDNGKAMCRVLLNIENKINKSPTDMTWFVDIDAEYQSLLYLPLIKTYTLPTVEVR